MKLISFVTDADQSARFGALADDGSALDLSGVYPAMLDLIEAGDAGLDKARKAVANVASKDVYAPGAFEYRAPLERPVQIRDFANYEKHCLQALDASMFLRSRNEPDPDAALERFKTSGQYVLPPIWYEQPLYFKGNRMNVIGHDQKVVWPRFAERMDYELELACVIGKAAKNVSAAEARDHIFGYTIYNDMSARDAQAKEMAFRMGPAKGKDFDTGNVFGPCIVTRDEIDDPYNLKMAVRVNGELKVETSSGGSQHSFERCIEHVSQDETIYPGEILALGTVGDGCGFEHLTWLEENDVIELSVEKIGALRNQLVRG